jgi:hypothetical protein
MLGHVPIKWSAIWWIAFGLVFLSLLTVGVVNFLGPISSMTAQVMKFQPNGQRLALGSTGKLDLRFVGRPGGSQYCFPEEADLPRFLQDYVTHNTNDEDVLIMSARKLPDGATLTAIQVGGSPRPGMFAPHVRVHSDDNGVGSLDCWISNWYYFKNVRAAARK